MSRQVDFKMIDSKYKLTRKIDQGAFGHIYQASNLKKGINQCEFYAVKIQFFRDQTFQLIYQCKLYQYFHRDQKANQRGIPNVYYCGVVGQCGVLVMDLMGRSLESHFQKLKCSFSLKTVLMLAQQMIDRIEYLHNRSFIHRDIKPDNFCMGDSKAVNKLFIIDFGLAKRYQNSNGKHIQYKDGKSLTGTARYASINTHLGIQQSRRDDLQSIAYVLIYLYRGQLPWQGLKGNTKEQKYQLIKQKKISTTSEVLCRDCPKQFLEYLNIVKNLKFQEKPDYEKLKQLFRGLFRQKNFVFDYKYDWNYLKQDKKDGMKSTNVSYMS